MNKKAQIAKFVVADLFSAALAWSIFLFLRKSDEMHAMNDTLQIVLGDAKFYFGVAAVPAFWLFLYLISGSYHNIYRKARMSELGQTLLITLIGVIVIFFALILDDVIQSYKNYYKLFFRFFFEFN